MLDGEFSATALLRETVAIERLPTMPAGEVGMVPNERLKPLQRIILNLIYHRSWRGA